MAEWCWIGCHTCHHRVAITLGSDGADFPPDMLEYLWQHGWCTQCGRFGAYTHVPAWLSVREGVQPFEPETSRAYHLALLKGEGRFNHLLYDRMLRRVVYDGLTMPQSAYALIRASGFAATTSRRPASVVLAIRRGRQLIGHIEESAVGDGETQWPGKLAARVIAGELFESRFRALSETEYASEFTARVPPGCFTLVSS